MRKKIAILFSIILLGFLLLSFYLSGRTKTQLSEQKIEIVPDNSYTKTLTIAADRDYEPYSFFDENQQPSGHDIELIYAIANKMKFNVVVHLMSWESCKAALAAGEADLITGLDYTQHDYPDFLTSMAIHNDRFVCFGKQDFTRINELYGKKLATFDQSGSIAVFLNPYHLTDQTAFYPTYTEAMQSVIAGENDYAIARYAVGRRILAKLNCPVVYASGPPLGNNSACIGLNKNSAYLLDELNSTIRGFMEDGTMKTLSDKWLGSYVEIISLGDLLRVYRAPLLTGVILFLLFLGGVIFLIYRGKAKVLQREWEATARILEYQQLLTEATKGLYDNIYELDISHNRAVGESTCRYFVENDLNPETPYGTALSLLTHRHVKEEFIQAFLDIFMPNRVLEAFEKGLTSLSYECPSSKDRRSYHWIRISARLFYWNSDKSVRMIMFIRNIQDEKTQVMQLLEKARRDAMTGLYNKTATQQLAGKALTKARLGESPHALVIIDIDGFKCVNDNFGHTFGDRVIEEFARTLKSNARSSDIVGRVGGDEFLILFCGIPGKEWLEKKLGELNNSLCREITSQDRSCFISASIGVVLTSQATGGFSELYKKADEALYQTKRRGKNGYSFYEEEQQGLFNILGEDFLNIQNN